MNKRNKICEFRKGFGAPRFIKASYILCHLGIGGAQSCLTALGKDSSQPIYPRRNIFNDAACTTQCGLVSLGTIVHA